MSPIASSRTLATAPKLALLLFVVGCQAQAPAPTPPSASTPGATSPRATRSPRPVPTVRAVTTPEPTIPAPTRLPVATGPWTPFPSLLQARQDHTATVLPDGRILVVGGEQRFVTGDPMGADFDVRSEALASVELYLPDEKLWTIATPLHDARSDHQAVLLADGSVLVFAGGGTPVDGVFRAVSTAERFDPATGRWTRLDAPGGSPIIDQPIVLRDDRAFFLGSFGTYPNHVMRPVLLDPATNTWSRGSRAPEIRIFPAIAQLRDGTVLVAGGAFNVADGPPSPSDDVWRYDPAADTWRRAGRLAREIFDGHAFPLSDGRVLVIAESASQVYDPAADRWSLLAPPQGERYVGNTVRLSDGRILGAGSIGCSEHSEAAELYDPARDVWKPAGTVAIASRSALVALPDGRAAMIGGGWGCADTEHQFASYADAWVLDPAAIR